MGYSTPVRHLHDISGPVATSALADYMHRHGAGARALMAAFEHEEGFDALAAIESELAMPEPDPQLLMRCLEELLFLLETTSFDALFAHARYYVGRDILAAWNFHGARISELVTQGRRSVRAPLPDADPA